jgi:hypothetical protein
MFLFSRQPLMGLQNMTAHKAEIKASLINNHPKYAAVQKLSLIEEVLSYQKRKGWSQDFGQCVFYSR